MNIGSATSTQFFIVSHMRSTMPLVKAQSRPVNVPKKVSLAHAIAVNTIDRPPRVHATG